MKLIDLLLLALTILTIGWISLKNKENYYESFEIDDIKTTPLEKTENLEKLEIKFENDDLVSQTPIV